MLIHLNPLFKQEEMADGLTTSKSTVISGWFTGGGTRHGWGFETQVLWAASCLGRFNDLWPCWRKYVTRAKLGISHPAFSSRCLLLLLVQVVSSQVPATATISTTIYQFYTMMNCKSLGTMNPNKQLRTSSSESPWSWCFCPSNRKETNAMCKNWRNTSLARLWICKQHKGLKSHWAKGHPCHSQNPWVNSPPWLNWLFPQPLFSSAGSFVLVTTHNLILTN